MSEKPVIGVVVPAPGTGPDTVRVRDVSPLDELSKIAREEYLSLKPPIEVPAALLHEIYQYVRLSLPTHKAQGGHDHRKKLQKKLKELLKL